jgi:hypothetical protein
LDSLHRRFPETERSSQIKDIIQLHLFGYDAEFFDSMTAEHHRDGHIGSVTSPADNNMSASVTAKFVPYSS